MEYFDIHTHILPGVDDGAVDMKESMAMLDIAYKEGTRHVMLTPSYTRGKNSYTREELHRRFQTLQQELKKRHKDMQVYLGNEVLYEDGIVEDLCEGLIETMNNTKYVLVAFDALINYNALYQAIRKIIKAGFRPIIAHVEHYHCLYKHMERIEELTGLGATMQMNISGISGSFLDENVRWCKQLVREGCISFLGTDVYTLPDCVPYMNDYVDWIRRKCGEEELQRMLYNNAKRMIANQYIID